MIRPLKSLRRKYPPRKRQRKIRKKNKLLLNILALISVFGCLYFLWQGLDSVMLGGADGGWLVRTGDYIFETGNMPEHDLFSWTNPHQKLICYQWLYEVFAAVVSGIGGSIGLLGLLTFVAVSIIYLFFMPRYWLHEGVRLYWIPIFMLPVLTPFWFFARPQMVSYLAAFACVYLLEQWRREGEYKIFSLPMLTALWSNMHCLAALSPLLIAVYLVDSFFAGNKRPRDIRDLVTVLVLSIGALFVTPFDTATILAAIQIFTHTDLASCNELRPLYLTSYLLSLCNLYVIAAAILLIRNRRRVPNRGLVIALPALVAGLLVARLQPLAVLLSWPFLAFALKSESEESSNYLSMRVTVPWVAAVLALSISLWFARYPFEGKSAFGAAERTFLGGGQTLRLVAAKLGPGDRIFNDTVAGSRLIYLKGPPVFIDGRLFFYSQNFYREWLTVMNRERPWPEFAAKWKINAVVLSDGNALYQSLLNLPEWRLCLDDGGSSLWVRAEDAEIAKRLGVDFENPSALGLNVQELSRDRVSLASKHLRSAQVYFDGGKFAAASVEAKLSLAQLETGAARDLNVKIDSLKK